MPKTTAAEIEQRINKVFMLLLDGKTRYDILQYTATTYGINKRQTDSYIAEANALIEQEAEYIRTRHFGKAIAVLSRNIGDARQDKDWTNVVSSQRELDKLLSLYEPEAPKTFTLKMLGYEELTLRELAEVLLRRGINPNELLSDMLQEFISAEKEENSDE